MKKDKATKQEAGEPVQVFPSEFTGLLRGMMALCTQTMLKAIFPEKEDETEDE